MGRFDGKVVLVTASATGIGLGISRRMAQEGATAIISSRNQHHIDEAIKKLKDEGLTKLEGFVCDVGNKKHREDLLNFIKQKFGRLDVLVLNAAIATHFGAALSATEKDFDETFDINVKSAFFMVKEFHSIMPPGSAILTISSYVGYELEKPVGIYALSKTTVFGLTKLLAKELKDQRIRVNSIAPGLIRTKFAEPLLTKEEAIKNKLKIDRIGETEDIGATAAFLCSKDADYVNGEILMVAGFVSQRL